MAEPVVDQNELIAKFCDLTGITPPEAEIHLATNHWNLDAAVTEYYTIIEEGAESEEEGEEQLPPLIDSSEAQVPHIHPGGGRTVGGPIPQAISSSRNMSGQPSDSKPPPKKKFATLGDLTGGGEHGGHGHDSDDDSDDEPQDLFAGGEKSGLAVQNPDDLKRKILEKARKNSRRPGGDDPVQQSSHFTGTAYTLGGDDIPSQVIPDPHGNAPKQPERAERRLHFWADGFSVDDGPLYANSDPANAEILKMIKSGRAPLSIMNVSHAQEVDVKVEQHEGNYVAPKKKYVPFSGGGQRLGSPVPSARPAAAEAAPVVASAPSTSTAAPQAEIDDTQPTISIQIRLGDGTRLVSRFNTSHTIGDVYSFVDAAHPASGARPWTLITTFPSKELSDKSQVLGDMAEFKRGGTVVQKWN